MKFSTTIFTSAAMAIMSAGTAVNARIGSDSNQRELSESGKEPTNFMTWWDDKGDYSDSECLHYPYNLTPTMTKSHHYCAVSKDIFNDGGKGAACGDCYEISYDGGKSMGGRTPEGARAGSAKIQVINSGAGGTKHFDCLDGAFSQITGTKPDVMPITYKKIACP